MGLTMSYPNGQKDIPHQIVKLDNRNKKLRIKEIQNVSSNWLGQEGEYSLTKWKTMCEYCEIFVSMTNGKITGFLVNTLASVYQCDQMDDCLNENNIFPNKALHIMFFAVDPEFRMQGIGKSLFEKMYRETDCQSCTHYILAMRKMNEIANDFI